MSFPSRLSLLSPGHGQRRLYVARLRIGQTQPPDLVVEVGVQQGANVRHIVLHGRVRFPVVCVLCPPSGLGGFPHLAQSHDDLKNRIGRLLAVREQLVEQFLPLTRAPEPVVHLPE